MRVNRPTSFSREKNENKNQVFVLCLYCRCRCPWHCHSSCCINIFTPYMEKFYLRKVRVWCVCCERVSDKKRGRGKRSNKPTRDLQVTCPIYFPPAPFFHSSNSHIRSLRQFGFSNAAWEILLFKKEIAFADLVPNFAPGRKVFFPDLVTAADNDVAVYSSSSKKKSEVRRPRQIW